jgi:hypothetical protein
MHPTKLIYVHLIIFREDLVSLSALKIDWKWRSKENMTCVSAREALYGLLE